MCELANVRFAATNSLRAMTGVAEKCALIEILLGVGFGPNVACREGPLSGALIF